MTSPVEYLPFLAAAFGIPQYLPQIVKLRRTGDTAGVSWAWATLTSVNNAAWLCYFLLSGYWTAALPSTAASVLSGVVAVMLARRGVLSGRAAAVIGVWVAALVAAAAAGGRAGLGVLLAAALIVQVTPSVLTAYRIARPTGISAGTWALVLGELSCWLLFGLGQADGRLITLGATGVIAGLLMLARSAPSRTHASRSSR